MTEKYKKILLTAVIVGLLTALCAIVFLMSPSPFAAIVDQEPTVQTLPHPSDGRININTADKETLMSLPSMTEQTAIDILAYRETYRRFTLVADLDRVPGITKEMVAAWEPYIFCE